ncbi:uncharacterized protein LOC123537395 [Mercenaria mercenaria]|uniref:uncharacterized protein LOC123537395 n=1 Tax=Mercenaria mercenaria TaxID=6596 RepID=UPI001E1D4B6A|nr:uncharacterized protein LOC123537395 [Mercenaria mercenaria]XP_045177031.1 uncharacterized protein LOC123537395 [Mercenaria mercenaria]
MRIVLAVVQFAILYTIVHGHGRLHKPPSRATMWRHGYSNPHDTSDSGGNCGGAYKQHQVNGGKCGVCGDAYDDNQPAHEAGGKYANGIIVATYQVGQTIDVEFELTANHLGNAQFRLCQNNDPNKRVKQECFDKHLLKLENGDTKYEVGTSKNVKYKVRLPADVNCTACVLQWRYTAGNNWGTDPATGKSGKGLGPQETFQACADVAIIGNVANTNKPPATGPKEDGDETENDTDEEWNGKDADEEEYITSSSSKCSCTDVVTPAMCHTLPSRRWSNRH